MARARLVLAVIIGSGYGVLQSILHFNLTYMVRAAFGIAIRKWPRDAVPLAAAVVLIAVVTMVVSDVEIVSSGRSARWHRDGRRCRPAGQIRDATISSAANPPGR